MSEDICRFRISCVPPTANHQSKKIVTIKTRDGRQFSKLADKSELVTAKRTLDELLIPHQIPTPVQPPVVLAVIFTWPWLESHSNRFRAAGRRPHTSKPDLSNVVKTLEDRLVQLRFLEDDRSVVETHLQKWWGDAPGIEIAIASHPGRQVIVQEGDLFSALREEFV